MLDIQFIRENADQVRAAIANKRLTLDLDELLAVDKERREATTRLEQRRARKTSCETTRDARARRRGSPATEMEELEPKLAEINRRYQDLMLRVPSLPRPEVPIGAGEEDNVEVRRVGQPRAFDFKVKDHVELMTLLGLVDWDGPRRFAGARS
jgi:seryl-tRNA synthetase